MFVFYLKVQIAEICVKGTRNILVYVRLTILYCQSRKVLRADFFERTT
jgi:hypothetical protein